MNAAVPGVVTPTRINLVSSAVMWPWFLGISALTLGLGVLVGLLAAPLDRARRSSLWVHHLLWGHVLFGLGPLWAVRRTYATRDLGPGPFVIVSNHASLLDIPINLGLRLPIRVTAREGLFRVPFMGWYMRFSRQILVDTGSREAVDGALESCRDAIRAGVSVLVFPEGTRSEDGQIGTFHKGAFRVAQELGVPLLPVVIDGPRAALPKGKLGLVSWYATFRMHVLAPVPSQGADGAPLVTRVLTRRVRDAMVTELDRMRAETTGATAR